MNIRAMYLRKLLRHASMQQAFVIFVIVISVLFQLVVEYSSIYKGRLSFPT